MSQLMNEEPSRMVDAYYDDLLLPADRQAFEQQLGQEPELGAELDDATERF